MQGRDHILIIEDDPAVGESLRDSLTSNGFQAEWKSTGGEGVRYAQDASPDLVILDVRLPDGSGFDFCRQMRQMRLRQPILMLTARREEADKILGLEMGADDYLTKPYSASELLARVRALLRRAYGELASDDANTLYAGDLVIDRGRGQVSRGSQLLNVTPTEFRMLVYLAQNAGHVVSRGQILDAVWGYEADLQSERTVNVHIRRLREKVEPDPSRPTIVLTVPGLGYRLAG
ncbi:MAG: response regulator transcription factor [Chloroflexi bacterium]|nr:response regulator transcription factor [Chloroflexota bacterium]MCH8308977.1 response regulator transcription factor [Chloroflexota bacterium]